MVNGSRSDCLPTGNETHSLSEWIMPADQEREPLIQWAVQLRKKVRRFRGGVVFESQKLVYRSKKKTKKKKVELSDGSGSGPACQDRRTSMYLGQGRRIICSLESQCGQNISPPKGPTAHSVKFDQTAHSAKSDQDQNACLHEREPRRYENLEITRTRMPAKQGKEASIHENLHAARTPAKT